MARALYRNNGLAGDKRSSPAAAGKDGSNKVGHVQLCPYESQVNSRLADSIPAGHPETSGLIPLMYILFVASRKVRM